MSISTYTNSFQQKRFQFLDALRGIACLAVTLFHLVNWGPVGDVLPGLLPEILTKLISYGWLGVPVFFVISGFVIAHSTRNFQGTLSYAINFVLRRFIRLAPPFWLAILSVVLLNFVSNRFIPGRIAPIPTFESVLFHLFFLNKTVKGLDEILIVAWTLALEMQFYFLYIVILCGTSYIVRHIVSYKSQEAIVCSFAIIGAIFAFSSLLVRSEVSINLPLYFAPLDWYAFFLGTLLYWMFEYRATSMKLILLAVILLAATFYLISWNLYIGFAVITALIVWVVGCYGHLDDWLSNPVLQCLGKISYSLYLFHTVVGPRVINILYRFVGNSPGAIVVIFIVAFLTSILAAHIIYYLVEKPSISLSRHFKISIPVRSTSPASVESSLKI